jgi:hypothetical protein
MKNRCFFVAAAGLLALLTATLAIAADTAVIKIQYRMATELQPTAAKLASPDGYVGVDQRTNALIVIDTAERIDRIRSFVQSQDQPVRQARITVRFYETDSRSASGVAASGRVSGDDWSVGTPGARREGLHVTVQDRESQRQADSEYHVTTMSGGTAYVKTGSEIPYRQRWVELRRRHARVTETVVFREIETGFDIKPVITGDRAMVEITPRIMQAGENRSGVIRFAGARTTLTVPLGRWVTLAGSDGSSNEVISEILSRGSGSRRTGLTMALRVDAD